MVDVNRLRVFRAVVASGSVGAAATHLGYTPSAVSQHLSALAKETGLTLFEKSGRGIAPTAAGLELASRSEELMSSIARLDGEIDDLRSGRTQTLSVSTFASAAEEWMPDVASTVLAEFPDVVFTFRLNENGVAAAPTPPDIDIRTEVPEEGPTRMAGYERHVVSNDRYVVLLPAGHRLAGEREVKFAVLADEPWIDDDPGETTCGGIVVRAARAAGITPRYVAYAGDHHGGIAFVAAGIGVTIVPGLAAGNLPPTVVKRPLVSPTPERRIVLFVHRQAMLKPAGRRVVELLTKKCAAVA